MFAVDSVWTLEADESGQSIRAKTISLLLTPEQTERVMLAHELGKIRLALRSPNDHEEAELPDKGHQVGQIFGDSQMADIDKDSVLASLLDANRQMPEPSVTVESVVTERPSHTVRVISGAEVQEVVMQSQAEAPVLGMPNRSNSQAGSAASLLWKIISAPASNKSGKIDPAVKLDPAVKVDPGSNSPTGPTFGASMEPGEPEDLRVPVMDD